MSNPKKLHPLAALLTFFQELKGLVLPVVFLVFIGNGEKNDFWDYLPLIGLAVVILFVLISGIVKWLRFTYRLEENELKIEYGLFIKKKRYIPVERIQSLDLSEGLLHRMFGLVRIRVETAGAGSESESEAELTAITKADAHTLQQLINQGKRRGNVMDIQGAILEKAEVDSRGEVFYQARLSELLLLAATSGGIGVVISAVFAFLAQFQDIIPYEKIFKEASHFVEMGTIVIGLVVFLALFVAWIISIGLTLLKYARFTLSKGEENVVVQKGLVEKQQLTIPIDRIQGITILENPLRQALGYCSVHLESAGGTAEDKDSASMIIMPMVKKDKALTMLADLFPEYCFSARLTVLPARAASRYIGRACLYIVPPSIAAAWIFWPFGIWILTAFVLVGLYGFARFRAVGWNIKGSQLTVRTRKASLKTIFILRTRIQSLEMIETWRQRQRNLASVHSVIRSGAAGKK
ncbi:MAG TPA: PH domain-containing protein [Pseudobacillus sp.]